MDVGLPGKAALVLGGRGLGRAIARGLAREGSGVAVTRASSDRHGVQAWTAAA